MEKLPAYAISPHFTTTDFPGKLTLDNKIDIFVDRVSGWQIGIATEIIKHNIQHSGFAVLQIIMSYFETIGKYSSGYIGDHGSKVNFKIGMKRTFPEIGAEEEEFLNSFYEDVRNGLYHIGLTKTNVGLFCDIPGSIGFNQKENKLVICPERLVEDIDIRFRSFTEDLRDPKNEALRKNFELRFDYDNSPPMPLS